MFVVSLFCFLTTGLAHSESFTLQDIIKATAPLPRATIFVAKEVVTLDPNKPSATAVAVVGDRFLATGTLEQLKATAGDQPFQVDNTLHWGRCPMTPPLRQFSWMSLIMQEVQKGLAIFAR